MGQGPSGLLLLRLAIIVIGLPLLTLVVILMIHGW